MPQTRKASKAENQCHQKEDKSKKQTTEEEYSQRSLVAPPVKRAKPSKRECQRDRVRYRRANLTEEKKQQIRKRQAEAMRRKRQNLTEEERNVIRKKQAERQRERRAKLNAQEVALCRKKATARIKESRLLRNEEELLLYRMVEATRRKEQSKELASVASYLAEKSTSNKQLKPGERLDPNDNKNDKTEEILVQIRRLKISVTAMKKAGIQLIKNYVESSVCRLKGITQEDEELRRKYRNDGKILKRRQRDTNSSREVFPIPYSKDNEQFVCIVCNEEFDKQNGVKNHFATHTEKEMSEAKDKYALDISEESWQSRLLYYAALTTFKCEICSEKCYTRVNYRKHIAVKHKESKELVKQMCYPCSSCDEIFIIKPALITHQRVFHNIFTQCPLCSENFESQDTFAKHLEETHPDCLKNTDIVLEYAKGFFCKVCGVYGRSYSSILTHSKEAHLENQYFQCEFCESKFWSKNSLSRHKRESHKEKLFCCELCGKQFHKTETLRLHKRTHKTDIIAQVDTKVQCKECRKTFANKSSYMVHYMSAHKEERHYRCTVCEKTFTCPSNLHQHKVTVCEKDKAVAKSCPTCGKRLDNYLLLYYHKTNIHKYGNTEENVCHLCQKTFKHSFALCCHNRDCHKSNQNAVELKCAICDKTRPNKKSLLEHWRLHREEHPYKCSLCEMTFKGAHQFYVHKKNDHQNEKKTVKLIVDSKVVKKLKADFHEAHAILFLKDNNNNKHDNLKSATQDPNKAATNTDHCNLPVDEIITSQIGDEEIFQDNFGRNKSYIDFSRANIPVCTNVRLRIVDEELADNLESRDKCVPTRDENPIISQENPIANELMESDVFESLEPSSPMDYSDNDSVAIDEKPFIFGKHSDCKDPFEKRLMVEIERLDECFVCTEVFSSSDLYNDHLNSKRHRAAIRARKREAFVIKKKKEVKKKRVKSDAKKVRKHELHKKEKASFPCPFCDEKLKSVMKYRRHIAHHKRRTKCLICAEKFVSVRKLVNHYTLDHNEEHIVKCDICSLGFLDYKPRHLQIHKQHHHTEERPIRFNSKTSYSCDICGERMRDFKLFRSHILTHDNDTHKCVHCAKEFKVLIALEKHYNETHNGKMPFPCLNCPQKLPTKFSLQLHEKRDHGKSQRTKVVGNDLISCSFCNEKFTSVEKYRRHKSQHQKRASCLICPEVFPTVRKLVDHYISEHNGEKIVKCEICDKPFLEYQERNLREHIADQHGEQKRPKSRVEKNYTCDLCGVVTKGAKVFKTHLMSHKDEKHKCKFCTQEIKSLAELESHYKESHNGEMPFPCKECPIKFPIQSRLQLHQKEVHPKDANYIRDPQDGNFVCHVCGKKFQNKGDFAYHKTTHDPIEMRLKFFCEFCGKSFLRPHSLNIHRREHTGERPYSCTQCEMAFISPAILKQHVDTVHMKNSHLCDTCGKSFDRRKNLVRHHKINHSAETERKSFSCLICFEQCRKPEALEKHMKLHDPNRPFGCDQCSWRFMHSSNLNLHKKGVHQKMGTVYPKRRKIVEYENPVTVEDIIFSVM